MGFKKHGVGEVIQDDDANQKTASADKAWTEKDEQALLNEE